MIPLKIALIADTHLFSSEIGGNWAEDSFSIFQDRLLKEISKGKPSALIFLGDNLDPHSGRSDPRWPRGDEASIRFVKALKESGIERVYALKGNHDYEEPMKLMAETGTPYFIDNSWVVLDDIAFYFFTSRYPDLKKAVDDLKAIPEINAKRKVLLMHESISIEDAENLPKKTLEELSKRYNLVLNGHEHAPKRPAKNVFCISSALPWRAGYGTCDLEILWSASGDPQIKQAESKFGYWTIDTEVDDKPLIPEFVPVDIGIKIAVARLEFSDAPVAQVRERLIRTAELIASKHTPKNTVVRVYLSGTLKEGDERIDVDFGDIGEKHYSCFYEGKADVFSLAELKGGGSYLSKDELSYVSIEDAVQKLKKEFPNIEDFYREVYELIERKSFDPEALIERVKNSRNLGVKE